MITFDAITHRRSPINSKHLSSLILTNFHFLVQRPPLFLPKLRYNIYLCPVLVCFVLCCLLPFDITTFRMFNIQNSSTHASRIMSNSSTVLANVKHNFGQNIVTKKITVPYNFYLFKFLIFKLFYYKAQIFCRLLTFLQDNFIVVLILCC